MTEAQVARIIAKWRPRLGLDHWTIVARVEETDLEAQVQKHIHEKYALLTVHRDTPTDQLERNVVHELLHIVFDRLEFFASEERPVLVISAAHDELEAVINLLATNLTGKTWRPWHEGSKALL